MFARFRRNLGLLRSHTAFSGTGKGRDGGRIKIALVLVGRAPEFMVLAAFLLEVRTAFVWETFRLGLFSTELVVYQVISFFFYPPPRFLRSAL